MSAYIEVKEDTFVRAVWNVGCDTFDVLGWMYRPAGKAWVCGYRFRFYRDARAFNSDDEKRGWVIQPSSANPPEAELVKISSAIDVAFSILAQRIDATVQRLDLNCMGIEAMIKVQREPWAHTFFPSAGGKGVT